MSIWNIDKISHCQELEPIILELASNLTKRSRDAFIKIYDGEVAKLAYTLLDPCFNWKEIHQLGDKSIKELNEFSEAALSLLVSHKDAEGLEEWERRIRCKYLADSGIHPYLTEELIELWDRLGYFPASAMVAAWIKGRDERDQTFFNENFGIWTNRTPICLADMASNLGITNERARQIRMVAYKDLTSFVSHLHTGDKCPYDCLDKSLESTVAEAEGTCFNGNFLRYIIGSIYPGLRVVGNVQDSILPKLKGGCADAFVAAINEEHSELFDFERFISTLQELNQVKRTDIRYISLPQDEGLHHIASKLANLMYGWEEYEGQILVPANADKNLPEIVEDILRDAGHTLSLAEIMKEFSIRYPNRIVEASRIRGNIHNNPNIRPIGRSGVYSLAEWKDGNQRGGTIRQFVRECLDESPNRIVPTTEVLSYVRQFRPETKETALVCNLSLESSKMFSIVWKDDVAHIMYSEDPIPEGFRKITRTVVQRRTFQESMSLVNSFIEQHGHLPRYNGDDHERRLSRFLITQRNLQKRGLLNEEEQEILSDFYKKINPTLPF